MKRKDQESGDQIRMWERAQQELHTFTPQIQEVVRQFNMQSHNWRAQYDAGGIIYWGQLTGVLLAQQDRYRQEDSLLTELAELAAQIEETFHLSVRGSLPFNNLNNYSYEVKPRFKRGTIDYEPMGPR